MTTIQQRWQGLPAAAGPGALRVGLLASYTIDPLVPHLGVALHDAGLPAQLQVGPYHQIVQQLLDDDGAMFRLNPDVVVVAPRFEELPEQADLLRCAAAGLEATRRRGCRLVFVLPPIPERRPYGVGEAASPTGAVAGYTTVRELLRERLAGLARVDVADAEEVIRQVGAVRAHHPSLFAFARVPYTDEFFAALGCQLRAVLRVRYRGACRAVVLDADTLLWDPDGAPRPGASWLAEPLRDLRAAGVRLAVRGGRDPDETWDALATALPRLVESDLDGWAVDDRPVGAQVRDLAAGLGVDESATVLIGAGGPGPARVSLGDRPEEWPAQLMAAGLFDRLPPRSAGTAPPAAPEPAEGLVDGSMSGPTHGSAQAYIDSLRVNIAVSEVDGPPSDDIRKVVARAKDFTLGLGDAVTATGSGRRTLIARVSDRLGDYGVSAVIGVREEDPHAVVDLFSISCAVLGKDVERAVLQEVVEQAAATGHSEVRLRYRKTGRNQPLVDFVSAATSHAWPTRTGRELTVRAEPVELGDGDECGDGTCLT
ncbi:hypothetical protein [Polymorphospora sp. NPDC050346]|uniref:hypothetical protein n=1 Tax=Polymorphospora sp. NPDC050346 TaxID=3155780 RepID=UPI0033EFDDAB